MKKGALCFLCVTLLIFGISGAALPAPIRIAQVTGFEPGPDGTGLAAMEGVINSWMISNGYVDIFPVDLEYYAGTDLDDNYDPESLGHFWAENGMHGYWYNDSPYVPIDFITIQLREVSDPTGPLTYTYSYTIDWFNPPVDSWPWDRPSGDVDILHFTAWKMVGEPVPEPTTILLLGSGLVGLAGFRRKFKKN